PKVHGMEYRRVLVASAKKTYDLGEAGGQLIGGTSFDYLGGAFGWEDTGGTIVYESISLDGEEIDISLSTGRLAEKAAIYVKDAPPNVYCKLGVKKTIQVRKFKLEKRRYGASEAWSFDGYITETKMVKTNLYIIRC
ncbi:MAG: hypothetical protein ACK5I7_06530, partial [Anaerotignum sp.]